MNATRAAWDKRAPVVPRILSATAKAPPSDPRMLCEIAEGTCRPTRTMPIRAW